MRQDTSLRQYSHHFRAMGTDVGLWLWNTNEQRARDALFAIERFFAQTETRLSRFRPDSELSRLNRSAGRPFTASRLLFDLVENALAWRRQTDGIFDPAVLNALMAYGYDRPFGEIQAAGQAVNGDTRTAIAFANGVVHGQSADLSAIQLGPNRQIILPPGVGLDLGGIAKGWTIQQAAYRLGMWGPCLVDAGGDIACVGAPPAEPWVVTVAHPLVQDQDVAVLGLKNETVATSSRVYRQWQHAGALAHHLIDPRTGAPAQTNILSVTVVAPRLPDAEIHAKTALILGETSGLAYLSNLEDISALVVCENDRQLTTGAFEERAYVSPSQFAERFRTPA